MSESAETAESAEAERPPDTEPALRTLAMPADANPNGDIFGGWVLAQMDLAGGVVAARRAGGRFVTVAVEAMRFHAPIAVGDLVTCYARVVKSGRTSITVAVETWARAPAPQRGGEGDRGHLHLRGDRRGGPPPPAARGPGHGMTASRHRMAGRPDNGLTLQERDSATRRDIFATDYEKSDKRLNLRCILPSKGFAPAPPSRDNEASSTAPRAGAGGAFSGRPTTRVKWRIRA